MEHNLKAVKRKKKYKRFERATETLDKTGDMKRFFRKGTMTKLYADGDRPLVLRVSAENPEVIKWS